MIPGIPGVQIVGIIFACFMIYLTFLYYKRGDYVTRDFFMWLIAWLIVILILIFPQVIYGVRERLMIQETVDVVIIAGFMFFSVIVFYLYTITKKTEGKVEKLVRQIAIDKKRRKDDN